MIVSAIEIYHNSIPDVQKNMQTANLQGHRLPVPVPLHPLKLTDAISQIGAALPYFRTV